MIYNLLGDYKDNLLMNGFRPSTVETYHKRLSHLFVGQPIEDTVNRLDFDKILNKLSTIKHKNYFSQSKNAFLHFCEFQNISLSSDTLRSIEKIEQGTRKKYRKLPPINYIEVDRKIKHIRNKKLKLSYQVMLATGLRVSELASITKNDFLVDSDMITLNFVGKGGRKELVTFQKSEYPKLYLRIKEHVENVSSDKNVFYSAVYLMKNAKGLGFRCHDLRRIFAHLEYKKHKSKVKVKEKLRHTNMKNTNRYLRSKVKF